MFVVKKSLAKKPQLVARGLIDAIVRYMHTQGLGDCFVLLYTRDNIAVIIIFINISLCPSTLLLPLPG